MEDMITDKKKKVVDHSPKMETKRILLYLGITFFITFLYELTVVRMTANSSNESIKSISPLFITIVMFLPSLGVILTKLISKEGFKKSSMILPMHFKGRLRYYLLAWLLPIITILVGMIFYYSLFPAQFDSKLEYYSTNLLPQVNGEPVMPIKVVILLSLFASPIANIVTCFGEEWGWRGYLLPKMIKKNLPIPVILLINGVIWGLWHAPLTVMGHNYGLEYWGFPYVGIISMCLFCASIGVILSYVTLKSGSCLAGAIGHATINGACGISIMFSVGGVNPIIGPALTGLIGGIPALVVAVILLIVMIRSKKQEKLLSEIPY